LFQVTLLTPWIAIADQEELFKDHVTFDTPAEQASRGRPVVLFSRRLPNRSSAVVALEQNCCLEILMLAAWI
jgi:hypothetical protein